MSVDLWLIGPNNGEDWNFDEVDINGLKRDSYYWCKSILDNDFITKKSIVKKDNYTNNDQSGNTISFINCMTSSLEYKEGQMMNTLNVYEHKNYTIQVSYITDYNYTNSTDLNYFATMVNTECIKIYGPAIFYKTENGLTTNLTIKELTDTLLNFYYVVTYRYKNGKWELICCQNFEHEIERMFGSYYKKRIGDWIVLSEDKEQIKNLMPNSNNITDYTDLIWFKLKSYSGEIYEQTKNDITSVDDYKGLYMDIDKEFIIQEFF